MPRTSINLVSSSYAHFSHEKKNTQHSLQLCAMVSRSIECNFVSRVRCIIAWAILFGFYILSVVERGTYIVVFTTMFFFPVDDFERTLSLRLFTSERTVNELRWWYFGCSFFFVFLSFTKKKKNDEKFRNFQVCNEIFGQQSR